MGHCANKELLRQAVRNAAVQLDRYDAVVQQLVARVLELEEELLETKLERNFLNFQLVVNGIEPWFQIK